MIHLIIQSIESPDDRDFMENVYTNYKRLIYATIIKVTKDSWASEDIMQSVIIELIGKLPLLRTFDNPRLINYIIKTSHNTALNYIRPSKKVEEISYDDENAEIKQFASDRPIENEVLFREYLKSASFAWEKLGERNRQVLELKYVLGKTDKEIAVALGILTNSVRMTLTRARNTFKALLDFDREKNT